MGYYSSSVTVSTRKFGPISAQCRTYKETRLWVVSIWTATLGWRGFFVILCAIWSQLYNLKNVKNIYGECYLPATWLKVTLLHGWFSLFLNCTNRAKHHKEPSSTHCCSSHKNQPQTGFYISPTLDWSWSKFTWLA